MPPKKTATPPSKPPERPDTADTLTPDRIREIRQEAGLTLLQAAEAVGVDIRTWQRWEQAEDTMGHRKPRGPAAKAILAMVDWK